MAILINKYWKTILHQKILITYFETEEKHKKWNKSQKSGKDHIYVLFDLLW